MKRNTVIKIAISAAMLLLLTRLVDLEKLVHTLATIPAWTALVVVLGYLMGQVLSAYKWWLIARAGQVQSKYTTALKSYFIGMFANCFGLGVVGGDVARGVLLSQGQAHKIPAIASVVADRAHGLAVLALLGTAATLVFGREAVDQTLVYLLCFFGISIFVGWFIGPKILLRVVPRDNSLRERAEQILQVFPKRSATILGITAISIAFHLWQIGMHWVMGIGFGVSIPLAYLLVTIPFVNILSSLPISWNGLGVRENAYVFFLAPTVLSAEQAVAMGAVWLLAVTVSSAIGGIVAFLTNDFQFLRKETSAHASAVPR